MEGNDGQMPPDASPHGNKRKILPTPRIAFQKQLDILRAYSAASNEGEHGVTNEAVAKIVGLSASTVSLANTFLADNGLIVKRTGGHAPASEVVAFARSYQWDKAYAGTELGPLLRGTWFGEALMPRLQFSAIPEGDAIRDLGTAGNAEPRYRAQVKTLLDYLEAGNLILRKDGMIEADRDAPSGKPKVPVAATEPREGEEQSSAEPEPIPGGPLPLLIQGLLQELPRGGAWSRTKADRWLNLAKLTFETVYDFEDEPSASGTETGKE